MNTFCQESELFVALGEALEYPHERLRARMEAMRSAFDEVSPAAADYLAAFRAEIEDWSLERWQEVYTRTFDIAPQCVPYLSVHLFGPESPKRAVLMTGLKESYARAGYESGVELPDHVAIVLRAAPHLSPEEWSDLVRWCLPVSLREMARALEQARNPYQHLLNAVAVAVESLNVEAPHA